MASLFQFLIIRAGSEAVISLPRRGLKRSLLQNVTNQNKIVFDDNEINYNRGAK